MRQEMDRLMGRMQPRANIAPQVGGVSRNFGGPDRMSVNNLGDLYVIKAYLPDVDAADVSVRVDKPTADNLCEARAKQQKPATRRRCESDGAPADRLLNQFTLPEAVDGARITKTFKDTCYRYYSEDLDAPARAVIPIHSRKRPQLARDTRPRTAPHSSTTASAIHSAQALAHWRIYAAPKKRERGAAPDRTRRPATCFQYYFWPGDVGLIRLELLLRALCLFRVLHFLRGLFNQSLLLLQLRTLQVVRYNLQQRLDAVVLIDRVVKLLLIHQPVAVFNSVGGQIKHCFDDLADAVRVLLARVRRLELLGKLVAHLLEHRNRPLILRDRLANCWSTSLCSACFTTDSAAESVRIASSRR